MVRELEGVGDGHLCLEQEEGAVQRNRVHRPSKVIVSILLHIANITLTVENLEQLELRVHKFSLMVSIIVSQFE